MLHDAPPRLLAINEYLQRELMGVGLYNPDASRVFLNLLICSGYRQLAELEILNLQRQDIPSAFDVDRFQGLANLADLSESYIREQRAVLDQLIPEYVRLHPVECRYIEVNPVNIQEPWTDF